MEFSSLLIAWLIPFSLESSHMHKSIRRCIFFCLVFLIQQFLLLWAFNWYFTFHSFELKCKQTVSRILERETVWAPLDKWMFSVWCHNLFVLYALCINIFCCSKQTWSLLKGSFSLRVLPSVMLLSSSMKWCAGRQFHKKNWVHDLLLFHLFEVEVIIYLGIQKLNLDSEEIFLTKSTHIYEKNRTYFINFKRNSYKYAKNDFKQC